MQWKKLVSASRFIIITIYYLLFSYNLKSISIRRYSGKVFIHHLSSKHVNSADFYCDSSNPKNKELYLKFAKKLLARIHSYRGTCSMLLFLWENGQKIEQRVRDLHQCVGRQLIIQEHRHQLHGHHRTQTISPITPPSLPKKQHKAISKKQV